MVPDILNRFAGQNMYQAFMRRDTDKIPWIEQIETDLSTPDFSQAEIKERSLGNDLEK